MAAAKEKKHKDNNGNGSPFHRLFSDVANYFSRALGRPWAFIMALAIVIVWAITGPIFHYSDTWQLVINTGTTIVTFLMVFLIQNSQNRDGAAIRVNFDELIRISEANNIFVGIEHLTDEEIDEMRKKCEKRAKTEGGIMETIDRRAHCAARRVS